MKSVFIALALAVLTGCKPAAKPAPAPVPAPAPAAHSAGLDSAPEPRAATPVPAPQPPEPKITGGFGWSFGAKLPPGCSPHRGDGGDFYSTTTSNFPPFRHAVIRLLNDGRVYSISSWVDSDVAGGRRLLMGAFTKKYPHGHFQASEGETYTAQYGDREACLDYDSRVKLLTVTYTDLVLDKLHDAERKARDDARKAVLSKSL